MQSSVHVNQFINVLESKYVFKTTNQCDMQRKDKIKSNKVINPLVITHLSDCFSSSFFLSLQAVLKMDKILRIRVIDYAHLSMCMPTCSVVQSCRLCNPMDCSTPGFSVLGISQALILAWFAISFCRRYSQARDWTHVSCISCIGRHFLYHWATCEAWSFEYLGLIDIKTYYSELVIYS